MVEDSCVHRLTPGEFSAPLGPAVPPIEVHPRAGGLPPCSHSHQALLAPALPPRHRPWWPPSGLRSQQAAPGPSPSRVPGLCTAAMVLPARPAVSPAWEPSLCQPRSAPLCGTPRATGTPALTHVPGGRGSRLQLRAQGKDTHKQNAGGFHGAPRGRRWLAWVSRGLYLRGAGEGLPRT